MDPDSAAGGSGKVNRPMQKPFEGFLLASDLDGTLLNDQGLISQKNIDAVQEFVEGGGLFTIATGRTVTSAQQYVEQLAVNAPVIVTNGSLMYDYRTHTIPWDAPLPEEARGLVRAVLDHMPHVGVEISSGRDLYVLQANATTYEHLKYENIEAVFCKMEELPQVWHKVLYELPPERLQEIIDFCETIPYQEVQYMRSAKIFYEMVPREADKGVALHALAAKLGIPLDKTVAIGDYYNDLGFIKAGGIGITPQNAPDEIKKLADVVVCSNNEGAIAGAVSYLRGLCSQSA